MEENILGYRVYTDPVEQFLEAICAQLTQSRADTNSDCRWVACLNPHSYAVAKHDIHFSQSLKNANWLLPDGVGVVLASKVLGGCIRKRITGSVVFDVLNRGMNQLGGKRVFFLGATEETLAKIRVRMSVDYPQVYVAGTYSPPFKPEYSAEEVDDMVRAINAVKPDVLWVGMTAPKQEKWIFDNLHRLDVRFAVAIGAVFDFYTGQVKRSHPVFQRLGLEWLPRLIQQPRRLWRRMFVSAPVFLWDVARARFCRSGS